MAVKKKQRSKGQSKQEKTVATELFTNVDVSRLEELSTKDTNIQPRIPQLKASSMLVNLGAFFGDIGALLQLYPGGQLDSSQKLINAKDALITVLEELKESILKAHPSYMDDEKQKIEAVMQISLIIGLLKACNLKGFFQASLLIHEYGSKYLPKRVPWFIADPFALLIAFEILIMLKVQWDLNPPENNDDQGHRVEHDPYDDTIKFYTGGKLAICTYNVDKGKDKEAKKLADELDDMFRKCKYPDAKIAKRLLDLTTVV